MTFLRAFVCVTASVLIQFGYGQNPKIDSLKSAIRHSKDTMEVITYITLGESVRNYSKDSSLYYLHEAEKLAKEIGYSRGISRALFSTAVTHGMSGDYATALEYLDQNEQIAKKDHDLKRQLYINNTRGIIYKNIGDYPTSQAYYLENIRIVDSLDIDFSLSSTYSNLGILYDLTDEREKAMEAYYMSVKTYTGPDTESVRNTVEANIAVMEFNDGNYQKCLDILLSIVPYYEKQNNYFDLASAYSNIGNCYQMLSQWNKAEEYLHKSMEISKSLKLKQEMAIALRNLSEAKFNQGQKQKAIEYNQKGLEVLDGSGHYIWKKQLHELASRIHESLGNYQTANYHLHQYKLYNDSLVDETKIKELKNLEARHEVYLKNKEINQKELELSLLNAKIELENRRKVLLIVTAVLLIIIGAVLMVAYRRKTKANQLISQQRDKISKMNLELERRMLRAQMNPHFIFNSLNSIQHFITIDDKRSALNYLAKFSKLLRQILEDSINVNIVLEDEINLLKIYVELEALRFDKSFTYAFEIDENLDTYLHEVPILLVQPYIENAIIHGLMPKHGQKRLQVSFKDSEESIICVIEDNGVGRNHEKSDSNIRKTPSRGMSVTRQRIEALKKGDNQLVAIEDLPNHSGTRITVTIPKS